MSVTDKTIGNISVISIHIKMDVHVITKIEEKVNNFINANPDNHLIINLKDVEYMSSSGLRMLVTTMRTLDKKGKQFKLCNLNQAVIKILEVVELIDRFDIYETEEDAVKSFRES